MPAPKKSSRSGAAAAGKEEKKVKARIIAETKAVEVPMAKVEEKDADTEFFDFSIPKTDRYFEAVGRRKTAVARVRLHAKGEMETIVNDKPYAVYFPTLELQKIVDDPFRRMRSEGRFRVTVKVKGGGIHSQAEAIRLGISRALLVFNPEFRKRLKKAGFLTRDAREVERKKPGLKKARRAPQWQKR